MDQLGMGQENGTFIMGPNAGTGAKPIGWGETSDGLLGVEAGTGRLYFQQSVFGDTGIQGNTGIRGMTGIMGFTGLALGSTGIQGLIGDTGIAAGGNTGIQGVTGLYVQGVTGLVGNIGATGVQGGASDPWIIGASAGVTGANNIANWIYVVFQGATGCMPFYQ